jgi:hypothetical protein
VLVRLASVADISNTPTSKGVFVRFEPAKSAAISTVTSENRSEVVHA